ncbi:MAG TPA: DUF4388 domain-containing protein [Blastocatellia bacterium]|nr:DUF4388 domain-containing protein [Blastocatellia bacterium]
MELTGDLSDFALADILQILALSRKTGTLSLQNGSVEGRIIIEQGRITHASVFPGDTLADRLLQDELISPDVLDMLREIGNQNRTLWTFETLLIESGVMNETDLHALAKRHTQDTLGKLVTLEKGRFGIDLNQADLPNSFGDLKLGEGLEVSEALLEAAKLRDESHRSGEPPKEGGFDGSFIPHAPSWPELLSTDQDAEGQPEPDPFDFTRPSPRPVERDSEDRTAHLCSLLTELRHYSFEAEVSLLIMRYASEVATRGILFVVKDDHLWGLGQFGINPGDSGKTADEMVRDIRIALDFDGVFGHVAITGEPYVGQRSGRDTEFLNKLGGTADNLSMFALPLVCNGSTIFIIYGDNYPGQAEMRGTNELVALVNQASLVLEKIVLQRRVMEIESHSYAVQ